MAVEVSTLYIGRQISDGVSDGLGSCVPVPSGAPISLGDALIGQIVLQRRAGTFRREPLRL
jgi:hypothetical protein